jgi:hypothetical protein
MDAQDDAWVRVAKSCWDLGPDLREQRPLDTLLASGLVETGHAVLPEAKDKSSFSFVAPPLGTAWLAPLACYVILPAHARSPIPFIGRFARIIQPKIIKRWSPCKTSHDYLQLCVYALIACTRRMLAFVLEFDCVSHPYPDARIVIATTFQKRPSWLAARLAARRSH